MKLAAKLPSERMSLVKVADPRTAESFAEVARRGLRAQPKTLPCQYFYDAIGSRLFERICDLPEYYLTRTEDALLREHADAMLAGWDDAPALIELGSGSSTKTRRLIAAALRAYGELHYLPIDVSPTILEESARALVDHFPGLRVTGYAADYRLALANLAARVRRPKLMVFLGSSLGNYAPNEAANLLGHIARAMGPADRLLLGTDLDKAPATLEAAYNDAQGVTARFNLNLLARLNRELGATFDLSQFAHEARYCPDPARVEMHLVSRREQVVRLGDEAFPFRLGESIHTENSHKYTLASLRDLAARSGFEVEAGWTDPRGWFRVQRWRLRTEDQTR